VGAIVGESGDFGDSAARERFFAGLREEFDLVPEHPAPLIPFSGLRRGLGSGGDREEHAS
jgi:hypothetical protein